MLRARRYGKMNTRLKREGYSLIRWQLPLPHDAREWHGIMGIMREDAHKGRGKEGETLMFGIIGAMDSEIALLK